MKNFSIKVHAIDKISSAADENIDVQIDLLDGRKFTATLFTLRNLTYLLDKYRTTGECANGTYIWAADMIVVESLDEATIQKTIASLIETGDIEFACTELKNSDRDD
ncbi:hypothetical protein [Undibacterium sp. Tian12W]|uniref:hypothetical protein n=1 Tax=Undibacterium sp. Tian12W TaxID=3413054 RepID=UPI003BF117BE